MRPVSQSDAVAHLAAMVYMAGEPIAQRAQFLDIVQGVLGALEISEADLGLTATTTGGRVDAARSFSIAALGTLLDLPDAGALSVHGAEAGWGTLELHLHLRHNPEVPLSYQPPGVWYLVVGGPRWPTARLQDAALALLGGCAAALPILHGGATLMAGREQALSEASLVGVDLASQPEEFVRRWRYDSRNDRLLWEKARRVYWATLLGPRLAKEAGGAPAAWAAGAAEAREINGALLLCATPSIADSITSSFPTQLQKLRRWLWPFLIQNPSEDAPTGPQQR
jgi:hypothetical protein